jgi:intein/homing endonuclease
MDVMLSFNNDISDDWLEIELEDGKTIQVTPNHRMYVEGIGYVEAKHLTKDMELKII